MALDSRPLLFFEFVTHYGGSNKMTVRLARHLQRHTEFVVLDAYGTCQEYLADLRSQGVPVDVVAPDTVKTTIGGKGVPQRLWRFGRSVPQMIRFVSLLRQAVRRVQPGAIWVNSEKALFAISRAAGAHIPKIMYVHVERTRLNPLVRRDWKRVALAVGVSQAAVRYLSQRSLPQRIEVVHNGISVQDVMEQAKGDPGSLPGGERPLRLVMAASLIPLKNHAMAIEGLARFQRRGGQARLWICGDIPHAASDPYVDDLLSLPQRLGIGDRVHFLGWHTNIPAVIARADVVTLTSNTEGFGMAVLEAMALGKPVMVTRVGGIPEFVRDGIDGILLEPNDPAGFARGLELLSDPALRAKMGEAGRQRVISEFSLERQAERFFELVNGVAP